MALGRQLSKLFNPGPAKSYDPNREALFAQLLSSGSGQTNDLGSAIGNLAKFFVGSRGLKKQGQGPRYRRWTSRPRWKKNSKRRQSQALRPCAMAGVLGIEGDPSDTGVFEQNPNLMQRGHSDRANRPSRKQIPFPSHSASRSSW